MKHVHASIRATIVAGVIAVSSITAVLDGSPDGGRRRHARAERQAPATSITTLTENGGQGARIENEHTFQPGEQHEFYESHGFSPDGRQLLFSGNPERGQSMTFGDIYLYDLRTSALKNLTHSRDEWDEHAHFSPDGTTIVWMSSKEIPGRVRAARLRTDYWMMDADGSNKRRLTYFNTPGHPEFVEQGLTAADFAWSPDGSRLAAYLITDVRKGGKIVLIDMGGR